MSELDLIKQAADLLPAACPKFQKCNAPICPLDADWPKRVHHNGDRVCFYLIEAQKASAKATFDNVGLGYTYELIRQAIPSIISRHYPIKHALEQAQKTGSRMARKFGGRHER